eukprot:TRINITY_DN1086_c2_g1_i3.p1 TRINITY_DN1086_c2_g1~~TRINITY_DN1086_c2_g1_i3.p1  ORF type:complete len:155 (+),score=5.30 TRINITY_DN1086_c2_g1_i3:55-519(+)
MKRSAMRLLSTPKWNQGTMTVGVNDSEPHHPINDIYAGEAKRARRTVPSFMKEEYDYDTYLTFSWMTKNLSSMNGSSEKTQWIRPYQKIYEAPGGVRSRSLFKMLDAPIWIDQHQIGKIKGYRDAMGYHHNDPEQLYTFTMPDMTDSDLKPYVK